MQLDACPLSVPGPPQDGGHSRPGARPLLGPPPATPGVRLQPASSVRLWDGWFRSGSCWESDRAGLEPGFILHRHGQNIWSINLSFSVLNGRVSTEQRRGRLSRCGPGDGDVEMQTRVVGCGREAVWTAGLQGSRAPCLLGGGEPWQGASVDGGHSRRESSTSSQWNPIRTKFHPEVSPLLYCNSLHPSVIKQLLMTLEGFKKLRFVLPRLFLVTMFGVNGLCQVHDVESFSERPGRWLIHI